jgi:hypothetical protein
MNALEKLVSRACEMDMTEQDQWLGDVFMPSLASAELERLQAIEAAASDVAKNWFSDRQRTGWAMDNLVSALERKPQPGVSGDEKG